MSIYTVALSKGGSAKTTTAAEMVAELARRGRRVLAIDLDQQGNYTTRLGVDEETEVEGTAADVVAGHTGATEAAVASPSVPGAWVLAGSHELTELEYRPEVVASLRDYLPGLLAAGEWDDVVIDTPPALGALTMAALAAADVVIAAVACATESYDQLGRLTDLIAQRIAPRMRPGQRVHWIVPTQFDGRRLLDQEVLEQLQEQFPGHVTTPIRNAVAVRDAYTAGQPVSIYDPKAAVAADYTQALAPVLTQK